MPGPKARPRSTVPHRLADALADGFAGAGQAAGGAGAAAIGGGRGRNRLASRHQISRGLRQRRDGLGQGPRRDPDLRLHLGRECLPHLRHHRQVRLQVADLVDSRISRRSPSRTRSCSCWPTGSRAASARSSPPSSTQAAWSAPPVPAAWCLRWPLRARPSCTMAAGPGCDRTEVPAILQRGERVLSRAEVASGVGRGGGAASGVTISIDARGAQAGVAEQIDAKLRAAIPGDCTACKSQRRRWAAARPCALRRGPSDDP